MPMRKGNCLQCGESMPMMVSNRRYCACCQILRDMANNPNLERKCSICDQKFYPVRATYRSCPECAVEVSNPHKYPDACLDCGNHYRPAPGLTAYCIHCVQKTPRRRQQYVIAVKRVVQERVNALAGPVVTTRDQRACYGELTPQDEAEIEAERAESYRGLF